MARTASVAIGGYFPTATHLLPRIAPIIRPYLGSDQGVAIMDPCAGEGSAVLALAKSWVKQLTCCSVYTCEMEATRHAALKKNVENRNYAWVRNALQGDAFNTVFTTKDNYEGISILYLNPPYDMDRVWGRLEHKFLVRFTPALMTNGLLVFVVPYYALSASATYLATNYDTVRCYRFPKEDFQVFKQVVLVAKLGDSRFEPDSKIKATVEGWATNPETLPELPYVGQEPEFDIPTTSKYSNGLHTWEMKPVDFNGLRAKVRPWEQTTRTGAKSPIVGIMPDRPVDQLLSRQYPVATRPRPAHMAAGIAAGIFNGARVQPNDPASGLPELLIKGVFTQEYHTVEEKVNKKGNSTYTQVQQPRLDVTILDLSTHKYRTLGHSNDVVASVESLTVAGLLRFYGDALVRVMEQQCPVGYDSRRDRDKYQVAPTKRRLFDAQSDAVKALVYLLGGNGVAMPARHGKAAWLLGEIGSGKTTVALATAASIGAKRPLVICPPHLLDSWRDEIAATLQGARFRVINDLTDLITHVQDDAPGMAIAVMSRESAKLGHGWEGVGTICPSCGGVSHDDSEAQARRRLRCSATVLHGYGPLVNATRALAERVIQHDPFDHTAEWLLRGAWDRKRIAHYRGKGKSTPYQGQAHGELVRAVNHLLSLSDLTEAEAKCVAWCCIAADDMELTASAAANLADRPSYKLQNWGHSLLYALPPHSTVQRGLAMERARNASYYNGPDKTLQYAAALLEGESHIMLDGEYISWVGGKLHVGKFDGGSKEALCKALYHLAHVARFTQGEACNAPLYSAVAEPRRIALAQYIHRNLKESFDFLLLDEAHEYATDGAAQERAAHRLTSLGHPTVLMTGSAMNGYAESLFTNMWSTSPAFRREFKRTDRQRFIDRYGYRKRVVTEVDDTRMSVVAFGAVSERVETKERSAGNAPGVLPLFLLQYLLPISVTLHTEDLGLELPPCTMERFFIDPTPTQAQRYRSLQDDLVAQIRKDQKDPELVGKLFGQLAELPSYLDRATKDVGNVESGNYVIAYPESVGGKTVAEYEGLDPKEILPKERWMLDQLRAELAEGRNCMVFGWHLSLLPRIARLIESELGIAAPILYANKVAPAKRQEWINKNIVKKKARVLVTNPVAIQTGLNNLVHFSTEIWLENPAANPIIYRQAIGRVKRIGQDKNTRILFPVYKGTLQVQMYDLLLQKVAVSTATDGLDPESALLAAGVSQDNNYLTGLSLGKQLWAIVDAAS